MSTADATLVLPQVGRFRLWLDRLRPRSVPMQDELSDDTPLEQLLVHCQWKAANAAHPERSKVLGLIQSELSEASRLLAAQSGRDCAAERELKALLLENSADTDGGPGLGTRGEAQASQPPARPVRPRLHPELARARERPREGPTALAHLERTLPEAGAPRPAPGVRLPSRQEQGSRPGGGQAQLPVPEARRGRTRPTRQGRPHRPLLEAAHAGPRSFPARPRHDRARQHHRLALGVEGVRGRSPGRRASGAR